MRCLPLLCLALALVGCGSSAEQTGVPASSGQESVPADTSSAPLPEPELKPPPILLVYKGQEQEAVRGSYCVDYVDEATGEGRGVCADAAFPIYPKALTSVAGGERVTFVFPDAILKPDSVVTIRPLGCSDKVTAEFALEPGADERDWKVDLDWGAYQLDVFARFEARDGRKGDVSGTLGLTVAGPKKWDALGVGEVRGSDPVCPFSD